MKIFYYNNIIKYYLLIITMGINNINKFLKDKASRAFFSLPIEKFTGKKIAIDGAHWAFTNMAIARKKVVNKTNVYVNLPNNDQIINEWIHMCLHFILYLLSYNITPIFIFDGKSPIEKDDTKIHRRAAQSNYNDKIVKLTEQLKITPTKELADDLKKNLRNFIHILPENFDMLKDFISGIGVPCIQATGEGEQLCSSLCIEGIVAGVFSADTDNLVYGCPLLLTSFTSVNAEFECVRLDYIHKSLNITHKLFVDLCIMSGCDFNTNIYGYGAVKSYNLLKKHDSIDKLPSNLNITCLNHIRCREIFLYINSSKLVLKSYSNTLIETPTPTTIETPTTETETTETHIFDFNKKCLQNVPYYLGKFGMSELVNKLTAIYVKFDIYDKSENEYIKNLNLTSPNKYIIYKN